MLFKKSAADSAYHSVPPVAEKSSLTAEDAEVAEEKKIQETGGKNPLQ
jgi:hypothetical protein